jgi:hypothetical protein
MATYILRVSTAEGATSEEELSFEDDEAALLHAFSLTGELAIELRRGGVRLMSIDLRRHLRLRRRALQSLPEGAARAAVGATVVALSKSHDRASN